MSLSDLASLGSFVSGFAVLVSLTFLYFQLRQLGAQVAQAEKNQQASIRQGRADRQAAIAMGATDPALAEAILKAFTGAPDITATQLLQFSRYSDAAFHSHEDSFYQNQEGLLTDSAFAAVVNRMGQIFRRPPFRVQWKRSRMSYGAEFVEFVDRLIARTPVELRSYDPAEWLTAFAAEGSGTPS
jgi:hypothetical protein